MGIELMAKVEGDGVTHPQRRGICSVRCAYDRERAGIWGIWCSLTTIVDLYTRARQSFIDYTCR